MELNQTTTLQEPFNAAKTGRIALAIAITAVVSVITLGLLYSGLPPFGPINDISNAVAGFLIAVLVWKFHPLLREKMEGLAFFLMLLAWAGSAAIIVNSLLVAFGQMHWMTGGMYTATGYALLGIWLLSFIQLAGSQPFLTPWVARLGTIAGIGMLFGLLAGPQLAAGAGMSAGPLVWAAFTGAGAGWLLFPVWCWLVGRSLLNTPKYA